LPDRYDICAGVLITTGTLRGEAPPSARYPDFPTSIDLLRQLSETCVTSVHYCAREANTLQEDLERILTTRGLYDSGICRRIQLNVVSPPPLELVRLRSNFKHLEFILQLRLWGPDVSEAQKIAEYCTRYSEIAHYFLFDPSGGRGASMSSRSLEQTKEALDLIDRTEGIVIAGGLNGENVVNRVAQARRVFGQSPLSVDAEGRLRGGRYNGEKVGDRINPTRVESYLAEAIRATTRN
jgi:hypothetical protein